MDHRNSKINTIQIVGSTLVDAVVNASGTKRLNAGFLVVFKDCLHEETEFLVKLALPSSFNLLYTMWMHNLRLKQVRKFASFKIHYIAEE